MPDLKTPVRHVPRIRREIGRAKREAGATLTNQTYMKKLTALFAIAFALGASAQTSPILPVPPVLQTNTTLVTTVTSNNVPVLSYSVPAPSPATLVVSNGALSQLWSSISGSGILKATNYLIAPYGTYAPNAPTKYGGGLIAVYNVNNYVGLGLGLDWLGQFTLVSANASLSLPTHPLRGLFGSTNTSGFFYNFTVTPFALAGAGMDLGGTGAHTIWDAGLQTKFGHWLGGEFGAGVAYGAWQGSSAYDVKRYHLFLNWQKGF